ncbi:MAG: hypothetical protein QM610_13490 [Chitinophagaceae bacterium]
MRRNKTDSALFYAQKAEKRWAIVSLKSIPVLDGQVQNHPVSAAHVAMVSKRQKTKGVPNIFWE